MERLLLIARGVLPRQDHHAAPPVENDWFNFTLIKAQACYTNQNDHDNVSAEVGNLLDFMQVYVKEDEQSSTKEGEA